MRPVSLAQSSARALGGDRKSPRPDRLGHENHGPVRTPSRADALALLQQGDPQRGQREHEPPSSCERSDPHDRRLSRLPAFPIRMPQERSTVGRSTGSVAGRRESFSLEGGISVVGRMDSFCSQRDLSWLVGANPTGHVRSARRPRFSCSGPVPRVLRSSVNGSPPHQEKE